MWPLDRPAREVLKLPGETAVSWAVFDRRWYLLTYPEVVPIIGDDDSAAVLEYYLTHGQKLGHSPNCLFDEQWHRRTYPRIAERVASGNWRSAFDAYCRRGALDRSAHWLFDEADYRSRYSDLTDDVLAELGICNGYDHYLRHGAAEDRIGHMLFDPRVYLSNFDPADVARIRQGGVFQHCLNRIESGEAELATSAYFDPTWYLARYPEVVKGIEIGHWKSALHHYLCNDQPTAFDPLESFSESWYLQRDPGLQKFVEARNFRNGYLHFLRFGAKELRSPTASIDLVWYASQPTVRADLKQGLAPDAYAHWLTIGKAAGLPPAKPQGVTSGQARELFQQSAAAMLPIAGRFGYRFANAGEPLLSVVMVVRDNFAVTISTIASLRCNTAADIELIIVDAGSHDETRAISQYVPGARILRFDSDIGWSRAANAGRPLASAQAVLFLSSQARIAPGSVDRACARLATDASIGAIGGMILQAHGVIAQAGGILWNDGGIQDYKRGASPLIPEANFVRDVDFCAADFLLVRTALLARLDGFDHDCADGYHSVDLCLRIAQAGYRVVYDPSVMIVLGDSIQPGAAGDYFPRKHATVLAERFARGGPVQAFARQTCAKQHRVLFIEDTVPLRRIGSGFIRANDLVRVIASLGYAVTVFPVNGCDHDVAHVFADMPEQVEVMHSLSLNSLAAFLEARSGYYDTVWVARTHNLAQVRPILRRLIAAGTLKAQIVLDTEAATPHRKAMQSKLAGADYNPRPAMVEIGQDAAICQKIVAVTEAEAAELRAHGFPPVSVIGHMIDPNPTARPFARRSGMLFVGAIHDQNSPNFDSLVWFVDQVLPLIEAELGWETRLTIVGYTASGVDLSRFADHARITLRGQVADLDPLYNAHRIFVAPTRYAAGAPYKVLEAAARGVPVVATEVLREELDWTAGQELLAAAADDPAQFAAHVLTLYRDQTRWLSIREAALRRLQQENAKAHYAAAVASVLQPIPALKVASNERTAPNLDRRLLWDENRHDRA